jgi:hypothetical protein
LRITGLPHAERTAARLLRVMSRACGAANGIGPRSANMSATAAITAKPASTATKVGRLPASEKKAEGANAQLKTFLRGPGKILRSQSPPMIEQELWGYLLTHYAISALTCTAATAAGIDPDRVKPKRTIRAVRRRVADPAFPP